MDPAAIRNTVLHAAWRNLSGLCCAVLLIPAPLAVVSQTGSVVEPPEALGSPQPSAIPQWQSLGPGALLSTSYGLTSGRVTALALDPNDSAGGRLYVGTTGGGVWLSQNASSNDSSQVTFTPLTDDVGGLDGEVDPSLTIGAISVQPGGTGVVLAGTGDPNDALDSYYGGGILRSSDGGNTWTWIQKTADLDAGFATMDFAFVGEAFAGFAWSTADPNRVVAAVAHAREADLVGAVWHGFSYSGLYYSPDSGATWHLARIMDLNGQVVQGPLDGLSGSDGNPATAVVWNPIRKVFIAAVQYHGYYTSADGVVWTRLAAQPGTGLGADHCPTHNFLNATERCPIYRGALAVNPVTGDTFAWTVDENNQNQGIWQDLCNLQGSACQGSSVAFTQTIDTSPLEMNTVLGAATVVDGNHNLALAAIPRGTDTLLFAGAEDLWKCSLDDGCVWRNTTNTVTCKSAQVAPYQHAIQWGLEQSQHIFLGNDSGLWRTTDLAGESGDPCSTTDAAHFQNLNTGLGPLAEIGSLAVNPASVSTLLAGLGVNGFTGVKGTNDVPHNWPAVADGYGGPVAIDPTHPDSWYVNKGNGVSIYRCSQSDLCAPSDFGAVPVVSDADVGGDGTTMTHAAALMVDPLDSSQLLVGTCRVWRGPADGSGWSKENAVSPILDGAAGATTCSGRSMIRSIAALALDQGGEVVYAGTYGTGNGGTTAPGHIFSATLSPQGTWSKWQDVSLSPVTNDIFALNAYAFDISSLYIDPHDATGRTVYASVAGFPSMKQLVRTLYRSVDGGAHWEKISSNLPFAPVNGLVIDPFDANTAYVANDVGVYVTHDVSHCSLPDSNCWSPYGAGLPMSPVVNLTTVSTGGTNGSLLAGTYGRGLWQLPLLKSQEQLTTASLIPTSLEFSNQPEWTTSDAQRITLTNIGAAAMTLSSVTVGGDFVETDDCKDGPIAAHASCTIEVKFAPTALGTRSGQLTVSGNFTGGSVLATLSGTGMEPAAVRLMPDTLQFGRVALGATSPDLQITVENSGDQGVSITSLAVTPPFAIAGNACGTASLAAHSDCQLIVRFSPSQAGAASGSLVLVDALGTQTAQLSGTGISPATDALSSDSLSFPETTVGQSSAAQFLSLTNGGDLPLTAIDVGTAGPYQATSNCTSQLAAGASCAIRVVFVPTTAGALTGTLTVRDILRTQTVSLSGTGLFPPGFSVTPARLDFGTQGLGKPSAVRTVVLANHGGSRVTGMSLSIAGPFSIIRNGCADHLDAEANCTLDVQFVPVDLGTQTGSLTVARDQSGAQHVTLSGSGFDFAVSISGSELRTVASGQTATYTLAITPRGAGPAVFNFQCGSLPANAFCVFNPVTNSVAIDAVGIEAVQVLTATVSAKRADPRTPTPVRAIVLAVALVFLRPRSRIARVFLSLVFLVVLVCFVDDCTSSGVGGSALLKGNAKGAAAGTYTLPVTVSSSGMQHSVSLTLVVD